jgi:hypothetical protein
MSELLAMFASATGKALKDIKLGRFFPESERDLQALVFHHAVSLLDPSPAPLKIHAEPERFGSHPDLVVGDNELFVEMKLGKRGTGGYTNALKTWLSDLGKLRNYRASVPAAHCLFLAVDRSNYFSNVASGNFFNPADHGLAGEWKSLDGVTSYLIAKLKT